MDPDHQLLPWPKNRRITLEGKKVYVSGVHPPPLRQSPPLYPGWPSYNKASLLVMYSTSIRRHNITDDNAWLSKCTRQTLPVPPLERYIHILPDNVVKKRLAPHERGEKGYVPDFATLKDRDDNEIAAIKLVEDNLPNFTVRVPKLVYQGAE
jgi:hypothetical protein